MFRSLYARMLTMFLVVLMLAMGLLSVLLYYRIRSDKLDARLDELMIQASDVAYLAGQRGIGVTIITDRYLLWKSEQIMQDFDATILIIDRSGSLIPIGEGNREENTYDFTLEETIDMFNRVISGEAVRLRTRLETGSPVFTVGVPYVQDERVLGAVFVHTSAQSVEASYRPILMDCLRALLLAFALGAALILVLTQLITRPLKQMATAAERYARGDFSGRVEVHTRDEVAALAEAFNRMAGDLDRLEQTRRGFVANVSHELRSPLTSIQGFINGILDGTVPQEESEHYLGIVLEETRRLNKLISTLLDLSQMDSGENVLTRSRFDINEMIVRVLFRQEGTINARNMDVQIDFAQEACFVLADPDRIEQVLINLIDNAVKYGGEGGQIRLSTQAAEAGQVRVAVTDDGQGIPEEDLPFVFERFYKADKAHTTGKGTGLGLAIAKSIVDQHGQTIGVTSAPGAGTTFSFTLEGA